MTELIFFFVALLIAYTYFGYPILLFILSAFLKKPVKRAPFFPKATIVIPVYNEEKQIRQKIENCLNLDYPEDKFEIIVASDHSTDRTDAIVREFPGDRVRLVRLPVRGGKVAAQNHAVRCVDSDIILFTDVAITSKPDALRLIMENFNDSRIGIVSCRDMIIGDIDRGEGERGYIRYDMLVRKYTSRIGSMIGVTGGFYAMRTEIARGGWNPAFPPDFYSAMRALKRGARVVEDVRVKAYYKTAAKDWDELPRKVRTINRGLNALFERSNRSLLNPFKHGFVAIQFFSHKVLRWLSPFLLFALFTLNASLALTSPFFFLTFFGQLALYIMAAATTLGYTPGRFQKLFRFASFFLLANAAIFMAWIEFFTGRRYVKWRPTKR